MHQTPLDLSEDGSLGNHGSHNVRVHVGGGPSVLKVSLAFFLCVPTNSDRCTTVCDALHNRNPTIIIMEKHLLEQL